MFPAPPMFKLRPYTGALFAAVFFALTGGLLSCWLLKEDRYISGSSRGTLCLAVTILTVLLMLIVAFSRYRFKHLHHHRPGYKCG